MGIFARISYRFAKTLYPLLKRYLKPLLLRHPRLHRFASQVREPLKDLLRSPSAQMTLDTREESSLPLWLIEEWKDIHQIEPRLYPEKWLLDSIQFYLYDMPESVIGSCYPELCKDYGSNVSHVFIVPWLLRGGADLVVLNYVHALTQMDLAGDIVVIATLDAESPWAERLPHSARFIPFGRSYAYLSPEEQEKLLVRLLLQTAPGVIHNINSDLGYRIFVKYGRALSSASNLYVSSFCIDPGPEGNMSGYPVWYLPGCFDVLTAVLSDNRGHLDKLNELYGFPQEKMYVHYQPMQFPALLHKTGPRKNNALLQILWAGRLDKQKRPDILIEIARKSLDIPFHFHVYGSPVIDMDIYTKAFAALPNITYHGSFDGIASLPVKDYDVFLYTSQWDGLPNVLLEAISFGLPVIASDVGGISELITDGETGFLVDPYDDTDRFVHCLRRIPDDRSLADSIAKKAHAFACKRHSWDVFKKNLGRVPGYIGGNRI